MRRNPWIDAMLISEKKVPTGFFRRLRKKVAKSGARDPAALVVWIRRYVG